MVGLKDRVAIVTGAGSGIGRAIAQGYAKEGANLVIVDVSVERAEFVAKDIESLGSLVLTIKADVSKRQDVEQIIAKTLERFGRIDILVNSAGTCTRSKVVDMSDEDWDRVINVNLKGTFLCCRAVAKHMIEQGSGRIINITAGTHPIAWAGGAHYSASKGGVNGLTKSLAEELAPYSIFVNALGPPFTKTLLGLGNYTEEETEQYLKTRRRIAEPEEVVGLAVFLATDASKYTTGQIFLSGHGLW